MPPAPRQISEDLAVTPSGSMTSVIAHGERDEPHGSWRRRRRSARTDVEARQAVALEHALHLQRHALAKTVHRIEVEGYDRIVARRAENPGGREDAHVG